MKIIFNWIISIIIILLVIPGILIEGLVFNKKSDLFIKADYLRENNLSYSFIIKLLKEEILLGIILYLIIGLIVRGF